MREFYARLPRPVLIGLEATGSMYWFLALLKELGIPYQVGDPVLKTMHLPMLHGAIFT